LIHRQIRGRQSDLRGRKTDCRGLTQTEMAYLMISLGAEKAINLDGGGSATLVKKEVTGRLETQNDVSSLRNVSTAIGAFDKGVRGKTAKSGEIISDKNVVLPHQSVKLSAVFYDEYGNRLQDGSAVTKFYDANGNTLSGGVFTPTSNGKYTLYAACHDIVCSTIITVSDKINSIDITNGEFIEIAEGKSKDLDCVIYDTEGNKIIPDKSLIKWSSDNSNVTVKNGTVYVKSKDGAIISASYDGKTDYICINQKPHEKRAPFATQVKDNFNTEILSDIKIAISGEVPKGATLLNRYYSLERLNTINKYHKAYVTKNYYKDLLGSNTTEASSYTVYNIEGTTFATLSTSEGYVKNASEWVNLYTATTGSNKNLVIITEKSPLELPEEEETRIKSFFDNATKNGKNVFYVYSGDVPRVDIENGVRYISLGRVGSYLTSNMNDNKAYCTYLEFYVKGNEIGYNFIS